MVKIHVILWLLAKLSMDALNYLWMSYTIYKWVCLSMNEINYLLISFTISLQALLLSLNKFNYKK